jgi:hypothetical protein
LSSKTGTINKWERTKRKSATHGNVPPFDFHASENIHKKEGNSFSLGPHPLVAPKSSDRLLRGSLFSGFAWRVWARLKP